MGEPGTHCLCVPKQFRYIPCIIWHNTKAELADNNIICGKGELSSIKQLVERLDPFTCATPISTVCKVTIPVTALSTVVIGGTTRWTQSLVLY